MEVHQNAIGEGRQEFKQFVYRIASIFDHMR